MVARLLSDPLPLRPVASLASWRSEAGERWLPWVYGRATLRPVPLDASGREWLVADHPIVSVDRVTIDGRVIDGWQLVQRLDDAARPIAVLRLTQSPQSGQFPAVTVIGRRHADTGAALEHPADIAADLLRQCGWALAPDAFQGLRDVWPGIALGLVIDNPQRVREALSAVIEPLGAWWRTDPPRAGQRTAGTPSAQIDAMLAEQIRARAESAALATVATVRYGYDWAEGAPRSALSLTAPEAVQAWGEIETTIDLPAVRTARDALAIGAAELARLARPMWRIDATVPARMQIQAGDTVSIAHPRMPTGDALVLSTALDRSAGTLQISAELPAGEAPRVELALRATATDPAVRDERIVYRDGTATFTIADDTGAPLAGATVRMDGQQVRETDRLGRVQFPAARGPHTLEVFAHGFAPFTMEVLV